MLHRSFARGQRRESQPCMQYATRASMRSLGSAGSLPANARRDGTGSGSVITGTTGSDSVLSGVINGGCQVARTRATLSHLVGSPCSFQTFFMCSYILQYIAFHCNHISSHLQARRGCNLKFANTLHFIFSHLQVPRAPTLTARRYFPVNVW